MNSSNDLKAYVQTTTGDPGWDITGDTELLAGVASARYEVHEIWAMHTDSNDVVADRLMIFTTNDTRWMLVAWRDIYAQAVTEAIGSGPPMVQRFVFNPPLKVPGTADKITVKSAVNQNWEWQIMKAFTFA